MALDYLDIYCERLEPGLLAEPLNALTNLAFIIAAGFILVLARREKRLGLPAFVLAALMTVIGIGSGLFHTFATHWAMLTDTLPILFFQLAFLFFYARGFLGLTWPQTAIFFCAFILCIYGFGLLPSGWLNGSLSYAPAFIFLFGLGVCHRKKAAREKNILLLASGIFAISLTFRSLDMALCPLLPLGLHFLWHILNSLVLYFSARAVVLNTR